MPSETHVYDVSEPGPPHPSPPGGDGQHGFREPPTVALQRLSTLFAELKEYSTYFLNTKIDGTKASIRNLGIYAALGAIALLAGATALVTAVVLLLVGIAIGLGWLFGGRFWLGELVVGIVVLSAVALGAYIFYSKLTGSFRRKTVMKYEQRQDSQRERFGRDITAAAAQHRHD